MEQQNQNLIRRLFSQSSHYFIGSLVVLLSHFISFPIYTRIFSVSDYGILGLITVTISTLLAVSKLGLGNSAVRFYEECKLGKDDFILSQYYSTLFWASVGSGCILTVLAYVALRLIGEGLFTPCVSSLLCLGLVVVFLRTVVIIQQNFLRAEQKTKLFNIVQIAASYSSILLAIFFVFFFIKGLRGFFTGQIIALLIILVLLLIRLAKRVDLGLSNFSFGFLSDSIKFGAPLLGLEFFNHILSYADRYIIQYYHGAESLGIYSVGYNLCSYLGNLLYVPLSMSLVPLLMETWSNNGKKETQRFLTKVLRYYLLGIFPVVLGFIAISNHLIPLLASPKYIDSYKVVPLVIGGVTFFSFTYIFNAGLIIEKKTDRIMLFALIAGLLNVCLNLLLIPGFGIIGAAYATFFSYLLFLVLIIFSSFSYLSFRIPFMNMCKYFAFSLLMYAAVRAITLDSQILTLFSQVFAGIFVYSTLVMAFDGEIRTKAMGIIGKILRQ